MKRNYTISGLKALPIEGLDLAQVTLNSRVFPSKRSTVYSLKELRASGCNTPIIIHYDFIYIASRYGFLSKFVRDAIIAELKGLDYYIKSDSNVLGIVMHTDYPLKKEFMKAQDKSSFINDSYKASIWDKESILHITDTCKTPGEVLSYNLLEFKEDIVKAGISTKIYLENTTKTVDDVGTFKWLWGFIEHNKAKDVFGLCYDTEHQYAINGEWFNSELLKFIKDSGIDVMVHLNTVPEEVKPFTKKDKHSFTTIYECSLHDALFYKSYADALDRLDIPWVREVKQETMEREWNLL